MESEVLQQVGIVEFVGFKCIDSAGCAHHLRQKQRRGSGVCADVPNNVARFWNILLRVSVQHVVFRNRWEVETNSAPDVFMQSRPGKIKHVSTVHLVAAYGCEEEIEAFQHDGHLDKLLFAQNHHLPAAPDVDAVRQVTEIESMLPGVHPKRRSDQWVTRTQLDQAVLHKLNRRHWS